MALEPIHLALLIRLVNIALLGFLIHFYFRGYRKIKSGFTGSLLLFAVILFAQNVFAIFFRILSGVDYTLLDEVSMHNLVLNILQMTGLIFLVNTTRK
ncbi:MAG: hypothetical protein JW789_00040 [Candidatus Aenigmarchaeota archaeon]|nr:hypothetical protein [Candidatus Aenigmarchaeota archaeon]